MVLLKNCQCRKEHMLCNLHVLEEGERQFFLNYFEPTLECRYSSRVVHIERGLWIDLYNQVQI